LTLDILGEKFDCLFSFELVAKLIDNSFDGVADDLVRGVGLVWDGHRLIIILAQLKEENKSVGLAVSFDYFDWRPSMPNSTLPALHFIIVAL